MALRALPPGVDVQHISLWLDGAYKDAQDDLLLEACWQDRRVLVFKDRAALPGWIALRIADGRQHAGVLFYDPERSKAPQIGALAKALATAVDFARGNFTDRWITLR